MSYEEELRAKLASVRHDENEPAVQTIDLDSHQQKILEELDGEFVFAQYDLDESDILRTLKISDILASYPQAFAHREALKLFYILCRIDVITPQALHRYSRLAAPIFKQIINAMGKAKLLFKNSNNELELTLEGKSLAARIGVDLYI